MMLTALGPPHQLCASIIKTIERLCFSPRHERKRRLEQAGLLPRTICHALIDNVSLNCLDLLPHQFAAVFGQPFAIRLRRRNVGVRVIFIRADCDGTQGAERGKCPPTAAMTYAVSAAPCRVIMAANDSAAGAARWHPAQARRGDGSRAAWRDNAWSGGRRYHLATGGSRGDHFPRGLRLLDYARRAFGCLTVREVALGCLTVREVAFGCLTAREVAVGCLTTRDVALV